MKFSAIHRPVSLCVMIAFAALLFVKALPAAAPPAEAAAGQPSAAAPMPDDDTPRHLEQEEDWPDPNKPRRAAPLVVAAVVAIVAAAVYFLVIKKPNQDKANTIVQVNSVPEGALVYYDIRNTGRLTPTTITNVTPIQHTIKLTKDGYQDFVTTFTIQSGQTYTINATLVPN
jgi:hypothetical protein